MSCPVQGRPAAQDRDPGPRGSVPVDSRDTASAALDVARPAGDAAGRSGPARASRGGGDPGAGCALAGALAASGLSAGAGLASRRNGPVPPATIYDVPSAAGVSIASVSRVLNGRRKPVAP